MENLILHFLVYEEDQALFSGVYFKSNLPNPQEYRYHICSSPAVRKVVVKAIGSLGVKKSVIHYEAFTF
ncbi:hypothetical protein [Oceanispirochaeta sp.]|uniref:hypothetical protein n=1 Tax=Oceanispirochaeta sp. TaxID=2035350 RepID=UPI00260BEDC7|nr:hypothetical protein [Oceanispirochaeta sp.]MDA3955397.1 hypothetical protein [Oceanispirochaeta sp.]